ncbi:MAG: RHS repeat-associated core domain-containing protein [Caldilineaceae bacterium]
MGLDGLAARSSTPASSPCVWVAHPAIYRRPGEEFQRSFARFGNEPFSRDFGRSEITIWRTWRTRLQPQSWDARVQALGGWTLSNHHFYHIGSGILYRGDGRQVPTSLNGRVLRTVAGIPYGEGGNEPLTEGALATTVHIGVPIDVAVSPDGSFYFSSSACIFKVDRRGLIHHVIVNRTNACIYAGDQPNQAQSINPAGISLAPNGDLYVANHGNNGRGGNILRIRPDGSLSVVAGNGEQGFGGDGGPATEAAFFGPLDVAAAPDGSVYVADFYNQRVRHVGLDGIITTVAGGGEPADGVGDGGPATAAKLGSIRSIAVDQNGVLYIGHDHLAQAGVRVRRVGLDGAISTVVGGGAVLNQEDELGAETALPSALYALAVGPDNHLYVNDGNRIRMLGADGRMTTVAGTTQFGYSPDGTPITDARLAYPSIAFAPNGTLYLAEQNNGVIRAANLLQVDENEQEIVVPSRHGAEIYVFNQEGRHLRTQFALTGATLYRFNYDAGGRLTSITDASGNVTTIERDGAGQPTALAAPFGQRTTLTVNGDGYLTGVVAPADRRYAMTYHPANENGGGLLATFTTPNQEMSTFAYDAKGRLLEDVGPDGRRWLLSQDGNKVAMTSGGDRTTRFTSQARGPSYATQSSILPSGVEIVRDVYASGLISVTMPDQTRVQMREAYDPRWNGQVWLPGEFSSQTPGGIRFEQTLARAVEYQNDTLTDLKYITDTRTINGQSYTTVYDVGQRAVTSRSPSGRQSTLLFDEAGRIVRRQQGNLASASFSYDARGLLATLTLGEGGAARTFAIAYDANGQPQRFTDPLGRQTTLAVNDAGRPATQTRPDGAVTTYGYDANGNLTTITPPGRSAHRFTYNARGQVTSYTPPAVGNGDTTTTYAYDADGHLTGVTRPDGALTTSQYDGGGRLARLELGRGAIQYSYDNRSGRLTNIVAPGSISLTYAYDGPLLLESRWGGPVAGSVQRVYDRWHRVTRMSVGNQAVSYTYDGDGLVTQAGALRLSYDENGLPTASTLNNVATASTRNAFGESTNDSASVNGAPLYDVTYTRDALGRIVRKVEVIDGVAVTYDYTYDAAGRLSAAQRDGVAVAAYAYDANGNRLSGPNGEAGAYDAQDRMTSYGAASYTYNAAGDLAANTEAGQTTTYAYDELSNLLSVALPDGRTIGYLIDGRNRRVGKIVDGALVRGWLYQDARNPIAEVDGTGAVVSRFVYATRRNVPDYMVRGGITYRIISDERGSPRLVINASSGEIAQRLDYDAFGNVTQDTNPGFQPFGFAGGLYDADTGLVRFGARDYDAASGRWTTKDPQGPRGGVNLYQYALGDPNNFVDLRGRTPLPIPLTNTSGTAMSAGGSGGPGGIGEAPVSGDFEEDIDTEVDERFHPFPDLPALPDWDEETVPEFEIPLIDVCEPTNTSETADALDSEPDYLPEMTPLETLLQALLGAGVAAMLLGGGVAGAGAAATTGAGETAPLLLPALAF